MEPYRAIWGHKGPYKPNLALRAAKSHAGPYGTIQDHIGPYRIKQVGGWVRRGGDRKK